ncbi:MAG: type II toxin-antitoxin system HicA family toxin [Patescibacteria group bacterium]
MRLPALKPKKVIKVLKIIGFRQVRQTGSHLILVNKITKRIISVPIHSKDIKRGLLFSIIKQADLTIEEFIRLL